MEDQSARLGVILSTERAGSTLLAAMLGGSRRVIAPPEMHLFRFNDVNAWRRAKPEALASLVWLMETIGEPGETPTLDSRFGGFSSVEVYRELLRLCGPERLLIDKTPAYAREASVLERIEALRPFYIWLIRHPLAVLASSIDRRVQRYTDRRRTTSNLYRRCRLDLKRATDRLWHLRGPYQREKLGYWCDMNVRIEAFLAALPTERSLKVNYEQLVGIPQEELDRLCSALSLEPEPAMLNPGGNVPSTLTWGLGSEKVSVHSNIDPKVANRWRGRFDESLLDERTREIMKRLNVT